MSKIKIALFLISALLGPSQAAAQAQGKQVTQMRTALQGVSGPMSRVAKKLGRLDYSVANGQPNGYTVKMLDRLLIKGPNYLPQGLPNESAKANREADGVIAAYVKAFDQKRSRAAALAEARDFMIDNHLYLSSGREKILQDIVRDSPKEAAARQHRRMNALKKAQIMALALKDFRVPSSMYQEIPAEEGGSPVTLWDTAWLADTAARLVLEDKAGVVFSNSRLAQEAGELKALFTRVIRRDPRFNPLGDHPDELKEEFRVRAISLLMDYMFLVDRSKKLVHDERRMLLERPENLRLLLLNNVSI